MSSEEDADRSGCVVVDAEGAGTGMPTGLALPLLILDLLGGAEDRGTAGPEGRVEAAFTATDLLLEGIFDYRASVPGLEDTGVRAQKYNC